MYIYGDRGIHMQRCLCLSLCLSADRCRDLWAHRYTSHIRLRNGTVSSICMLYIVTLQVPPPHPPPPPSPSLSPINITPNRNVIMPTCGTYLNLRPFTQRGW